METGSRSLFLSLHFGLGELEGDGKPKHRADARLALCANVSSHQFNELLANGQSQACASVLSGGRAVGLHKRLKQFTERAGLNADPVIDDGKPEMGDVRLIPCRFVVLGGWKFKALLGGGADQGLHVR